MFKTLPGISPQLATTASTKKTTRNLTQEKPKDQDHKHDINPNPDPVEPLKIIGQTFKGKISTRSFRINQPILTHFN